MCDESDFKRFQAALLEAGRQADNLIAMLKNEAEALSVVEQQGSPEFIALRDRFIAALQQLIAWAMQNPALLQQAEIARGLEELQSRFADIEQVPLDTLIQHQVNDGDYRYQRAKMLFEQGKYQQAGDDFIAVLHAQPTQFNALNDYAILLNEMGRIVEARALFAKAVLHHPRQVVGRINFADFLQARGDFAEAKSHYLAALELESQSQRAYQGLSHVCYELGESELAAQYRDLGYRGNALVPMPYRGKTNAGIPVLLLGSAYGGNIPLQHLLDKTIFQATGLLTEYFDHNQALPAHRLVINLIGDAERCRLGLNSAEALLVNSVCPVINHPALVRASSRQLNAQRFATIAGVRTPRMRLVARENLLQPALAEQLIQQQGLMLPVLIRSPGFHTGQYFARAETLDELTQFAAGFPGSHILLMEYLDAGNHSGQFHKLRVMFVDGIPYPLHLAISKHWKVHYFSSEMEQVAEYRVLEEQFIMEMPRFLGGNVLKALDSVRQVLGLDYGGVDFAIGKTGEVLLFEANATMMSAEPDMQEKRAYRQVASERISTAFRNLLLSRLTA
jgi:tetratricopeptide (TPR) repeat protein